MVLPPPHDVADSPIRATSTDDIFRDTVVALYMCVKGLLRYLGILWLFQYLGLKVTPLRLRRWWATQLVSEKYRELLRRMERFGETQTQVYLQLLGNNV